MSCIFCDIINKTTQANIIWESKTDICLLPKKIEAYGHLLVMPKSHVTDLSVASPTVLKHAIMAVKKTTKLLQTRLGATGANILLASGKTAQQSVSHLHFHVIARFKDDKLDLWPKLPAKKFDSADLYLKLKSPPLKQPVGEKTTHYLSTTKIRTSRQMELH